MYYNIKFTIKTFSLISALFSRNVKIVEKYIVIYLLRISVNYAVFLVWIIHFLSNGVTLILTLNPLAPILPDALNTITKIIILIKIM